jgi:MinD-like ATPase involved in chromosome partitioning or flagellar assembly
MPTIIFTAGAKGGTGKSTAVRFLITYLREHGFSPSLFDMDDESKTLSRFFPEATQVKIKKASSHDVLIEKIIEYGEKLIVADLKGGTGRDTLDWWLGLPFSKLTDIQFICIAAITSSPDSVQSFLNWAAALKDKVSYIVCKNQKDGDIFPDYDESAEAAAFCDTLNPRHVMIPRLDEEYMTELDRLNLTVAEVIQAEGSETINGKTISPALSRLLIRARLEDFQHNVYSQFQPVLNLLKL